MSHIALVGSRKAPVRILNLAYQLAQEMAKRGLRMTSGGAPGMDHTWEMGYRSINRQLMTIFLPNKGFNGKKPDGECYFTVDDAHLIVQADEIIQDLHPYYDDLEGFAYNAHIRNCFQILGKNLDTPADEVFLWAPPSGTSVTGGTRTAFELAKQYNIQTWNLYHPSTQDVLRERFGLREPSLDFLMQKGSR